MNFYITVVLLLDHFKQREAVARNRMHSFLLDQSDQMNRTIVPLRLFDSLQEGRVLEEAAILNCLINSGQTLLCNATGADIQMTHFTIALVSFRQSDAEAGGLDQNGRVFFFITIRIGGLGRMDAIGILRFAISPSISYN